MGLLSLPALAAAIVLLLPALQSGVHADLYFAYRNGELYAQIEKQFEDRATSSLYGFLQIADRFKGLSFYGHLQNVHSDFHHDADWGVKLSFWRNPGTEDHVMALWPNFDYWGWGHSWIAPDALLTQQFASEMPVWDNRPMDKIYWTGATMSDTRLDFVKCAEEMPAAFYADPISWDQGRSDNLKSRLTKMRAMKPVRYDLRKLLSSKFLIYLPGNTWSTSFKRIISAGAVVLVPSPNQYEDLFTLKLKSVCEGCVLQYDPANMCTSASTAVGQLLNSTGAAREMASRLWSFAESEFQLEKVHDYMAKMLLRLAPNHPWPDSATMSGAKTLVIKGRTLTKVTCTALKRSQKQVLGRTAWQVDEWYDDQCRLRDTDYTRYVAL